MGQRNRPRRQAPRLVDVRGSLHGAVVDAIAADDRAWFDDNPAATLRYRAARYHEFCDPACFPACVLVFEPPPPAPGVRAELWVAVRRLAPGVRTRQPYWVLDPEEAR